MAVVLIADPDDLLQPYEEERKAAGAHGADLALNDASPPRVPDAEVIATSALPFTAEMISTLERCQLLVCYGIGVDIIDVEAATSHGIVVANAPTFCVPEVADHAVALILSFARRVPWLDRQVRAGQWDPTWNGLWGVRRLSALTLGIVGMGKIGREVARRMVPFGVRLLAHDPHVADETIQALGATPVSFRDVLSQSDIVTLHVPLTSAQRRLIDAAALELMKPTAVLVNTCRGAVVDEAALIHALQTQRLFGAALDVLVQEPPDPNHPLLSIDPQRIIVTPHFAGSSEDSIAQLHREVAAAIASILAHRWPDATVNPQVMPKRPLHGRPTIPQTRGAIRVAARPG